MRRDPININAAKIPGYSNKIKLKAIISNEKIKTKLLKNGKYNFNITFENKLNIAKLIKGEIQSLNESLINRVDNYGSPLFLVFEHSYKDSPELIVFDPKMCCGQFDSIKYYKGKWHLRGFVFDNRHGNILKNLFEAGTKFVLNMNFNQSGKKIFPRNITIEPVGK